MSTSTPGSAPTSPTVPALREYLRTADCSAIRIGLTALLGVVIARFLGPSEYGLLSSGVALAAMLIAFTSLGLDRLVQEEVSTRPTESSTILGTAMGLRLAAAVVMYLFLLLLVPHPEPGLRVVWLVAGLMMVTQIPLTVECWLRAKQKNRSCSIALNVGFVASVLLSIAFIWNGVPAVWFVAVMVLEAPIAALLVFHSYGKLAPSEDTFDWSTPLARRWIRACWPVIASTLPAVALVQINHVLLALLRGSVEAGRFGAASRIFEVAAFVATAAAVVQVSRLRQSGKESLVVDTETLAPVFSRAAKLSWAIALIAAASAPWAVLAFLGRDYTGSAWTFGILGFALLPQVLSSIGREALPKSDGDVRRAILCNGIALALNLVLACWWISGWGAPGAAAATVVSLVTAHLVLPLFDPATRRIARLQWVALAVFGGRGKDGTVAPAPVSTTSVPPLIPAEEPLGDPTGPVST